MYLKVHYAVLGKTFESEEKGLYWLIFFLYALSSEQSLFIFITEQTNWPQRTTHLHTLLLCLCVADPATFLASNGDQGGLIPSENSLFIQLWKNLFFFWVCIFTLFIL